jgi:hypothetical protein
MIIINLQSLEISKGPSPAARSWGRAAVWRDMLLVHGGYNGDTPTDFSDMWVFNFYTKVCYDTKHTFYTHF